MYVEEFLCKMTENMQADVALSRKAVFVRCCLRYLTKNNRLFQSLPKQAAFMGYEDY